MSALPTVFVSHGPPTLALERHPVVDFLRGAAAGWPRPNAILCVSAHWETEVPAVSSAPAPVTVHDFYGFPEPLYRLRYPAPGAPDLTARVAQLLAAGGFAAARDADQGLDHGAWVPLLLMYADAAIPVAQLAIQHHLGPHHHLALGRALAPLRDEGVLILASGNTTHNLRDALQHLRGASAEPPAPPSWALAFDAWVNAAVERGDRAALADYRTQAPHAAMAHPRDEHYLPLLVAAGAGGRGRVLHTSFMLGSLSMGAYAFD